MDAPDIDAGFYTDDELDRGFSSGEATVDAPLILTLAGMPGESDIFDGAGVRSARIEDGVHSFFVARVPYIPGFRTTDFARQVSGTANGRVEVIMQRQIQFLNDLANVRSFADCSFALRYIANPDATDDRGSRLTIVLIGKTFRPCAPALTAREREGVRAASEARAHRLWSRFRAHFPSNEPFNYPLEPVNDRRAFLRYFQPIPFARIGPDHLVEIHKYEDYDFVLEGRVPRGYRALKRDRGYYAHPFSPAFTGVSPLSGLVQALTRQRHVAVASVSLRPTELSSTEFEDIAHIMTESARVAERTVQMGASTVSMQIGPHRRHRAEDVAATYTHLIDRRHRLFTMKIQVVGAAGAPDDVIEAMGSALIDHQTTTARSWQVYRPSTGTPLARSVRDFAYLEHQSRRTRDLGEGEAPDGPEGRTAATDHLERMPFLASAVEAAAAFRLPVPPESGYLPGLTVIDEPFVRPTFPPNDTRSERAAVAPTISVALGEILHRGTPTGQQYRIGLDKLARHGLIAGSTGSGKTNTSLTMLTDLWQQGVSFLVIYPIDKPDYRALMSDNRVRDRLLIYTLGDETVAPFRFNPFAVPDGMLLRTHLNLLMRCFSAAFYMWDVLPSIYRRALRLCYINAGWARDEAGLLNLTGGADRPPPPSLADFYRAVEEATTDETSLQGATASTEYMSNVRQGAVSRIRDLLANAGHVINTREAGPFAALLDRPVVMEIGRVGSSEDIALIMAFLLVSLLEELQKRVRMAGADGREAPRQHVTLLEEAHQLMPATTGGGGHEQADARGKASEEFSNILAEVRGFREAILIAEQMPSSLVAGAIANTHVKIMHWLESPADFDLFGRIMNLDESQKVRARTLATGEAIVRDEMSQPVHVRVNDYGRAWPKKDVTDKELREFMRRDGIPAIPAWRPSTVQAVPLTQGARPIAAHGSPDAAASAAGQDDRRDSGNAGPQTERRYTPPPIRPRADQTRP